MFFEIIEVPANIWDRFDVTFATVQKQRDGVALRSLDVCEQLVERNACAYPICGERIERSDKISCILRKPMSSIIEKEDILFFQLLDRFWDE